MEVTAAVIHMLSATKEREIVMPMPIVGLDTVGKTTVIHPLVMNGMMTAVKVSFMGHFCNASQPQTLICFFKKGMVYHRLY